MPGATQYDLIYKDVTAKSWKAVYRINGTQTLLNNLDPVTYQVKVRSRNGYVVSSWSDVVQFYGGTPKPPASVWLSSVSTTSALAKWSAVQGVSQYKVQWGQLTSDNQLIGSWKSKIVSGTSTTLSFLSPDSRYVLYVRSKYSDNLYSDVSSGKVFTTKLDCNSFSSDDTPNGARTLRVGDFLNGLICQGEEEDWYRVSNPTAYKKHLKVMLYAHPKGYRFSLYRKQKSGGTVSLVNGGPTGTDTRSIVLNNADFVNYEYYVQVWTQNPNTGYDNTKSYTVTAFVNTTPYSGTVPVDQESLHKTGERRASLFTGSLQVFPNPARGSATLRFDVPDEGGLVRVVLYDASGREVRTTMQTMRQGENAIPLALHDLPSGCYFVSVEAEGERRTMPLNVIR